MAKLETYEFAAPAHWASALINGDCTSFDDEEQAEFDAWVAANPKEAAEVVSNETDEDGESVDSWFGEFHFLVSGRTLGCDMLTYVALSREET